MTSLKLDKPKLNKLVKFYCINYKDENRRDKMQKRWDILDLDLIFVDPVETTDKRLDIVREKYPNIGFGCKEDMDAHCSAVNSSIFVVEIRLYNWSMTFIAREV